MEVEDVERRRWMRCARCDTHTQRLTSGSLNLLMRVRPRLTHVLAISAVKVSSSISFAIMLNVSVRANQLQIINHKSNGQYNKNINRGPANSPATPCNAY